MQNGEDIDRIDNFDESNPNIKVETPAGAETSDEKLLKKKLNELGKPIDHNVSQQRATDT
jgi:hypothetical protein